MSEQPGKRPSPLEIAVAVGEDMRAFRDDQQKMFCDASRAMGTARRQARAQHPWRWRAARMLFAARDCVGRFARWVDPTPLM